MQYIIAIGVFQAIVAIVLLWNNKLKSSADDLLILLVGCIGAHLAIKFFIFNFVQDHHVRFQMNTFIGLCYGPLLYLYTRKVQHKRFIPASQWYVFLPFILGAISYFTVAGVLFLADKPRYELLDWYNSGSFWVMIPSDVFFAIHALSFVRKLPAEKLRERQMIGRIAWTFLTISALALMFYMISDQAGSQAHIYFRSLIYAMLACLVVMIIRFKYVATDLALAQALPAPETIAPPAIPSAVEVPVSATVAATEPEDLPTPPRRAGLTEPEQQKIWQQLEGCLSRQQLFADSELNLDKLASATGISKYHISETLNNYAHKSFYQYINEYRIGFAVRQMEQLHEKEVPVNILSLAYDAGFKAKSSFNRYFKDITGVTPTEYLKSLQQQASVQSA